MKPTMSWFHHQNHSDLPITILVFLLTTYPYAAYPVSLIALYLALGHKSLHDHAQPVASALLRGDEAGARQAVSMMVSRDPATLDIPKSVIESVLENGNDAVFGTIFWFMVGGAPGVVFYRLANTMDAMWGYRNERFFYFGWAAARLDDVLNYIPARLTAISFAIAGMLIRPKTTSGRNIIFPKNFSHAISSWLKQAKHCESPNAGPVMAAGAGALNITIGGSAHYDGKLVERPELGVGPQPTPKDVSRALRLVRYTLWMWLIILVTIGGLAYA